MKTDLFQSCGHCWIFQICWHIECSTFTASSFRIWNSSTGIPSPPLALLIVMLPKAHLTLHSWSCFADCIELPYPLTENWIKDLLSMALPIRTRPSFPTVSLSHQEASISLLSFSIRGQTDWKPQSQKTNQTDHMDLTFQVPMQYYSLQHSTLFPSPVTSTPGGCFCFDSVSSFFLELFLYQSPVA